EQHVGLGTIEQLAQRAALVDQVRLEQEEVLRQLRARAVQGIEAAAVREARVVRGRDQAGPRAREVLEELAAIARGDDDALDAGGDEAIDGLREDRALPEAQESLRRALAEFTEPHAHA